MTMIYSLQEEAKRFCSVSGISIGYRKKINHTTKTLCPIWSGCLEPIASSSKEVRCYCDTCTIESQFCPAINLQFERLSLINCNSANNLVKGRVWKSKKDKHIVLDPLTAQSIICNRDMDLKKFITENKQVTFCCDGHIFKDSKSAKEFVVIFTIKNDKWIISKNYLSSLHRQSTPTLMLDLFTII